MYTLMPASLPIFHDQRISSESTVRGEESGMRDSGSGKSEKNLHLHPSFQHYVSTELEQRGRDSPGESDGFKLEIEHGAASEIYSTNSAWTRFGSRCFSKAESSNVCTAWRPRSP